MIRTDKEYGKTVELLSEFESRLEAKKMELAKMDLTEGQVQKIIDPEVAFYGQMANDIESYDRLRRQDKRELDRYHQFQDLGKLLIALRVFSGKSQTDLAKALDIDSSQVCRYERNEYQGISLPRVQKILNALHAPLCVHYRNSCISDHDRELDYV